MMGEVRFVDIQEIKRLRLARQHLLAPVDAITAASDLCGIQAQFLGAALHALRIRTTDASVDGLVKTWTLRGTVHLIPESDLPLYIRRQGRPEDVCESGWYQWLKSRGHALPLERETYFACLVTDQIAQGNNTREGLRQACREAGMTEQEEPVLFSGWGGLIGELAQMGVICHKVQSEKAYRLCPAFEPMPEEAAQLELARRYFTHYGPATLRDAAYFFRMPQKDIKSWLGKLPVENLVCEGHEYFHIPTETPDAAIPDCLFLAGFDQLMLGYRKEDNPFLPAENLRGIFNLTGIVLPPVLLHGRVVGKWKQEKDHAKVTLFEKVLKKDQKLIERAGKMLWKNGITME